MYMHELFKLHFNFFIFLCTKIHQKHLHIKFLYKKEKYITYRQLVIIFVFHK